MPVNPGKLLSSPLPREDNSTSFSNLPFCKGGEIYVDYPRFRIDLEPSIEKKLVINPDYLSGHSE